jgi:hypothetical protein
VLILNEKLKKLKQLNRYHTTQVFHLFESISVEQMKERLVNIEAFDTLYEKTVFKLKRLLVLHKPQEQTGQYQKPEPSTKVKLPEIPLLTLDVDL